MKKVLKSFSYAGTGIRYAFKGRNFCVQTACGVIALALCFALHVSKIELMTVIFLVGFVLSLEATNTALEEICNKFHPETHPHIALIKDLAAGAVLIAALTALVIGLLIFVPYIL